MKKILAMLLALSLLLTLAPAALAAQEELSPETRLAALRLGDTDKEELLLAAEAGLPLDKARQKTISGKEFAALLDEFIAIVNPNALDDWKASYPTLRSSAEPLSRFDTLAALFLAAQAAGEDYAHTTVNPYAIADSLDHAWDTDNLNWDLYGGFEAVSVLSIGSGEAQPLDSASFYYNFGRPSQVSGQFPFPVDTATNSLRGKDQATYLEALLAVARVMNSTAAANSYLVDISTLEARTAVLGADTLNQASYLPTAKWNSLPQWQGISLPNMQYYDQSISGQPQQFRREDVENIAALGFNFLRVPLDMDLFIPASDAAKVRLDRLENLDQLVIWCAEFGIHLHLDLVAAPGFDSGSIWQDMAQQDRYLAFWGLMAQRFLDVPSNLLSFGLMDAPASAEEEAYVDLMGQAIDAVRAHTPDRLMFVDMLSGTPVQALAEEEVAQSFHYYEPQELTQYTPPAEEDEEDETSQETAPTEPSQATEPEETTAPTEPFTGPIDTKAIQDKFREYETFTKDTGVALLLQEFGTPYTAPYDLTQDYFTALLEAADEAGIAWCVRDYFGPYGLCAVTEEERREDATYTPFAEGWIDTGLLTLLQSYIQ